MPNHVRNVVRISGSADTIKKLMAEVKGEEQMNAKKMPFDFNRITPMPPSLMIEKSSRAENGQAIIAYRERGDDSLLKKMMEYKWVKDDGILTSEALCKTLEKQDAEAMDYWRKEPSTTPFRETHRLSNVDLARVVEKNLKEHGYADWYKWSFDHWGTKWNAYDQGEPELAKDGKSVTYDFTTEWNSPVPVFNALVDKYPVAISVDVGGEVDQPYSYRLPRQRRHA